jgi:hypothetical protein
MVFWSLIINLLGFFVVNNGATMFFFYPQMMQCFVCHPIQLEHIDAHGKHKGTSSSIYEMKIFLVAKGCGNPK